VHDSRFIAGTHDGKRQSRNVDDAEERDAAGQQFQLDAERRLSAQLIGDSALNAFALLHIALLPMRGIADGNSRARPALRTAVFSHILRLPLEA
jgi:hypothetical protein